MHFAFYHVVHSERNAQVSIAFHVPIRKYHVTLCLQLASWRKAHSRNSVVQGCPRRDNGTVLAVMFAKDVLCKQRW